MTHPAAPRLFGASFVALAATSTTFVVRGDVLGALAIEFDLSHVQIGYLNAVGVWGFPAAILLFGPLCDSLGMKRLMYLGAALHALGLVLVVGAARLGGYPALLAGGFTLGFANGAVEAVINPLVATIYPDRKTEKINLLHAAWPAGMVVCGLSCFALTVAFGLRREPVDLAMLALSWRVKYLLVAVGLVAYVWLLRGLDFPPTERTASGVSNRAMGRAVLSPGFAMLVLCMVLGSMTEGGPDQWVGLAVSDLLGERGVGILTLVYTGSLMFVLRLAAGRLERRLTAAGLLVFGAAFAAAGLYGLSRSRTPWAAFGSATCFGLGVANLWPTLLGIASHRYPRTGALGLALLGAVGALATGWAGPMMGHAYDRGIEAALPADLAGELFVDGRYSPEQALAVTDPLDQARIEHAVAEGAGAAYAAVARLPVALVALSLVLLAAHRRRRSAPA